MYNWPFSEKIKIAPALFMSAPQVKLDEVGQIGLIDAIFLKKGKNRLNFQKFSETFGKIVVVESIIRDVFIAIMQDGEIERELLKETRTPKKAVELAIKIEMSTENQL